MTTIGERIKTKRKELGLTQAELAEKLNITDRAVSKWEQNDGNPDFSLLPQLTEILGVSLDYLITGKTIEPIVNLDDMDATKRAVYLAEKDDVDNFIKYHCVNQSILCNVERGSINNSPIKKAIYENESIKVFSVLLDEFIKVRPVHWYGIDSVIPYIYDDIDDFVKLCALANRIDVLNFIGFFSLSIGKKPSKKDERKPQLWSVGGEYEARNYKFVISKETFEFLFTDKRISSEMLDYVSTLHFIKNNSIRREHMFNDEIIFNLYKTGKTDLLERAMNAMYENLDYCFQTFGTGNNSDKIVHNGDCAYKQYDGTRGRVVAHIDPISEALSEAEKKLDIEWIKIFNDYNKALVQKMKLDIGFLSDEDIAAMELRKKPNVTEDEIIIADKTRLGLLSYHILSASGNDVEELQKSYNENKHLYTAIISKSYIHYMELIESLLEMKDYKKLFEFACDYELKDLEEAVLSKNKTNILKIAKGMFVPSDETLKQLLEVLHYIQETKEKLALYPNSMDFATRISNSWKRIRSAQDSWIKGCDGKLTEMLKRQCEIVPFETYGSIGDSFIQYCRKIKEQYYAECQESIENKIETITHNKALQDEYDNTLQTISEQYLSDLLQSGNVEMFIIKLCVRMDVVLKYKRYEGEDFFSRMDAFFKKNVPSSRDCDDGWGYYELDTAFEEKEVKPWQRRRELFNRLRMQRNNIAHSDNNNVKPLTNEELLECLKFVVSM